MRILIIGDLDGQLGVASKIAISRGAKVRQAKNIEAALDNLRSGFGADLILIDARDDIAILINQLEDEHIAVSVIACGVALNKEDAVRAIKAGAKEYLPLPPDEKLIAAILETITNKSTSLIYNSPVMKRVIELANQVAPSDATILITGKSGTGKEVIANYIHEHSKRSSGNFISLNCAAIPENLLESELFGHEKGAFTGALARRIGKFEEANHGTILLDEISEMDIRLQAKLLRAIQEREIERIGGNNKVKLDIRIIATSNRDLKREIQIGKFREDLYFRLNVINIHLPSLHERIDDILLFAEHFIKKYAKNNNMHPPTIDKIAEKRMQSYTWPGNVRELENAMHRAVLLAGSSGVITEELLMLSESSNLGTLASMEQDLISTTLKNCLGNQNETANILGISINILREKLAAYEIG